MTAGSTVTTGAARTHARAPRTTPRRTTGTATRRERAAGEHHPRRAVRATRSGRSFGTKHPVMVVVIGLTVIGEPDTGKEQDRRHEHNACHDHHPRRDTIEAGVLRRRKVRRRRRRRRPGRRLDRGFGWLGHVLIMPRQSPGDNQLRR
jgi:hypothetical protein